MHTREEELAMMSQPNRWPQWPLLPVKNPGMRDRGLPVVGIMIEQEHEVLAHASYVKPIVYNVNLYSFKRSELASYEKWEYPTLQDVVDAGWVVD